MRLKYHIVSRGMGALIFISFTMTACLNDTLGGPPSSTSNDVLGSVDVWPRATMMAVGTTQQIQVTPRAYDGAPLSNTISTFSVSNDTIVSIDSTGLLTALKASPLTTVFIAVRTTYKGAARNDTAVVRVTAVPDVPVRLSIAPKTDAGRYVAIGGIFFPSPRAYRAANDTTPTPVVWYDITTPQSGAVTAGTPFVYIQPKKRGSFWLRASTVMYGTALMDSVEYVVTDPTDYQLYIYNFSGDDMTFTGTSTYLDASGTFSVMNYTGRTITVTFEDPSGVIGGNMTLDPNVTDSRRFSRSGIYKWTSSTKPVISGKITIR